MAAWDIHVVQWYIQTERMLQEVLEVVPYCPAHENVWSPKLVTVLYEVGGQLDSLWKSEASLSSCVTKPKSKMDILDLFGYFGEYVEWRWVLLWGDGATKVMPFVEWHGKAHFTRKTYSDLAWWTAYNKLKHSRVENKEVATLKNAVHAMAGLFLAIITCPECKNAVVQADWVHEDGNAPAAVVGLKNDEDIKYLSACIETPMFSYPVGWCKRAIVPGDYWPSTSASNRFIQWFNSQAGTV